MELNSHMAVCCPPGSILNKYLFQWKIQGGRQIHNFPSELPIWKLFKENGQEKCKRETLSNHLYCNDTLQMLMNVSRSFSHNRQLQILTGVNLLKRGAIKRGYRDVVATEPRSENNQKQITKQEPPFCSMPKKCE